MNVNIRGMDPELWKWLRLRSVQNDRPMGQELNEILREVKERDEQKRPSTPHHS